MVYNLRNTIQIPKGKKAVITSPDGSTKILKAGEFISPEDLNKLQEDIGSKSKSSSNSSQSANSQEGAEAPSWPEIAQQFKMIDANNPQTLNQASYQISQFIDNPINTSSKTLHPASRFGAQFSVANLTNSIPGLKNIISSLGLNIQLLHPKDAPLSEERLGNKTFMKVGELDLKTNTIKFWQHETKLADLLKSASEFVSHKANLAVCHSLLDNLKNADSQASALENEIQTTQQTLKNYINAYSSRHKGKAPKPGHDASIDTLQAKLEALLKQKQNTNQMNVLLNQLVQSIQKEGGIDSPTDNLLKEHPEWGVPEQMARILAHANLYSLGLNNTFDSGLEWLAARHPETLTNMRNFITFLNQFAASQQAGEEEPQE